MKNKLVFFMVLLALTLFAAACGAQEATTEPGAATSVSTVTMDSGTATEVATEGADEAAMTPTGAADEGTPSQSTGETGTTPTASADGTAVIPQTGLGDAGLPDDVDEIVRVLIETGVTVERGDEITQDFVPVPGQSILINGEEVQIFTYGSAEELEAQVTQLLNQGDPED